MKNDSRTFHNGGRFVLAGACLVVASACVAADQDRTVRWAGKKVSDVALSGDAKRLTDFVGQNGITCGDSTIGRREILHDIADKSSWLYSYFFDAAHSKQHGKAPGLREYLQRAESLELVVNQTGSTYGCVRYKSSNFERWPEVCFVREGDHWVFTDGPYACP